MSHNFHTQDQIRGLQRELENRDERIRRLEVGFITESSNSKIILSPSTSFHTPLPGPAQGCLPGRQQRDAGQWAAGQPTHRGPRRPLGHRGDAEPSGATHLGRHRFCEYESPLEHSSTLSRIEIRRTKWFLELLWGVASSTASFLVHPTLLIL